MKKYYEIFKKCSLFAEIQEDHLLKMLHCLGAKIISVDKGYSIFKEGFPAYQLGIILSGSAQIVRTDYDGNRSIIAKIQPAELLGEDFACAEVKEMPVAIIADEPCEVMMLDCSHILHTCSNNCGFHQQLIYNLMRDLAIKTLRYHQKLEVISKRSTREKLMTFLAIEAKKAGKNPFQIPFDRQELADYLEVDRSGLSAEISKLRQEGVLESKKTTFFLY